MKELSFEEHIENLKKILQVDPCIEQGDEAKALISKYVSAKHMYGGYVHSTNTIAVPKSMRIGTLAHEMRHAWQYKNRDEKQFSFGVKMKKIKSSIVYVTGKKEYDANKFAFKYCWNMGLKKQAMDHYLKALSTWFFRLAVVGLQLELIWLGYQLRPYYIHLVPKLKDIVQIIL